MIKGKHLVIFRSSGSIIDYNTYNCQEIGLAKILVKKGFKVSVILAGKAEGFHEISVNNKLSIDLYHLPYKSLNQSICYFKGYKRLLQKLNPDIVQVHDFGLLMSYLVLKWAKQNHCRTVLIQGNYRETQKPILKQLELLFNATIGTQSLRLVDRIGCKTIMAKNYIKEYTKKEPLLTPIGLDTSKFNTPVDMNWQKKLDLGANKKILLYVGTMEERRNVFFLQNLLEKLPSEYILVMAGEGPQLIQLKEMALERGLEKRCFFLGKLKQEFLPSLYSIADLFLLASNYEIYGMVILEAMYFGLPVISSVTAGSETIISNRKDGLIINSINEDIWSKEIIAISKNNQLNEMKIEAQKAVQRKFIWEKAVDNFIQLYKENN